MHNPDLDSHTIYKNEASHLWNKALIPLEETPDLTSLVKSIIYMLSGA